MQRGNIVFLPKEEEHHSKYIVGLDASLTSFGVYCLPLDPEGEEFHWALQSTASKNTTDTLRVIEMATCITEDLTNLPGPVVFSAFEDYGPINRTSGKIAQRAEMCGLIKHYLLRVVRCPVITVTPTALKSFATGNGNSGKDAMIKAANKFGFFPDTSDEADAFHAARLGRNLYTSQRAGVAFERTNP